MIIPIGNHVLLCDHPEGRNKIQDRYKTDVYVVVGHHQEEPNVYYIQLLNNSKPGQPKVVNRHQLFDLKRSVPPSTTKPSCPAMTRKLKLPSVEYLLQRYRRKSLQAM